MRIQKGPNKSESKELENGKYIFKGYRLAPDYNEYKLVCVFQDNIGNVFQERCIGKSSYINCAGNFFDAFSDKQEADSLQKLLDIKYSIEKAETEKNLQMENVFKAQLAKNSDKRYLDYYNSLYISEKKKFRTAYKKWGSKTAKEICEGEVRLGWSKEKCRLSWGEPRDINTSIGSWGVHEQWCYGQGYLYFENGKLTSIQY